MEKGSLKELTKMLVEKSYCKISLVSPYVFFQTYLSINCIFLL